MTDLEVLVQARRLIENEADWFQAPENHLTGTIRRGGVKCRCAGAAIAHAGAPWPSRRIIWDTVESFMGGLAIYQFNAIKSHAEVLAAFDEAIKKLPELLPEEGK